MIELKHGNLLEDEAEALVNTVNCVGVMGKGIALQFKQAFPENFRVYKQACDRHQVQPGQMLVVPVEHLAGPKFIINFPTKRHWKGKSRIDDIRSGLVALTNDVQRLGIKSIALPPLGCGNGGLNWDEVRPLIEDAFAPLSQVKVLLHPPQATPRTAAMPVATEQPQMTRARALFVKLIERYREPGYALSLLEVQKLAYFLQSAGEPLRLKFVKHMYGPYADNLNHVLQRIEGHFIRGYGDRSRRAEITLLPGVSAQADSLLADDADAQNRLQRVTDLIEGFETPYGMELLATVHWVVHEQPAATNDVDACIREVQEWSPRKRDRLKSDHIQLAWQRLRDKAWFAEQAETISSQCTA